MVRADLFIFGYSRVTFPPECAEGVATLLLRHGISARLFHDFVLLRASDFERIRDKLLPLGVTASEVSGLFSLVRRAFSYRGVIAALALVLAMIFATSGVVWEIDVAAEGGVSQGSVISQLKNSGFGVGTRWSEVNTSDIENALLLKSDDISWISINRRGSVAYVEVMGKEGGEVTEPAVGYSNIVAVADCVIEEITVSSGYAAVSVGDAVSAGDLLISGVIPAEAGGGYTEASGRVLGRLSHTLVAEVSKNEPRREPLKRELCEISLQIFDFSVNIFKKYGNVDSGCDIIKDIEELIVLGKHKLPVSLTKTYAQKYADTVSDYTDEELVKIASARLFSMIRTELYSSDVVAIRSLGEFTEAGYAAKAHLTVVSEVGERVKFEIQEQ